jgi:DNA primase
MPGSGPTLYRLPELRKALADGVPVFVAEGEKDADSLRAAGVAATCNSGGAGKFPSDPSLVGLFEGATVVVVADRDRPGLRHALDVREKLRGVAASVEIRLPAVGKDVSDHLHNGLGLGDLVPFEEPRPKAQTPRASSLEPWGEQRLRAVLEWDTEV